MSTHDVLASWRGVGVETKGDGPQFRKRTSENPDNARVVAPAQINSFAMEFMVEISCLRKSATSSFCKVLLHRRDGRGFGKVLIWALL